MLTNMLQICDFINTTSCDFSEEWWSTPSSSPSLPWDGYNPIQFIPTKISVTVYWIYSKKI